MFELITAIVFIIAIYIISRTISRQVRGKGCGSKKSCGDCSSGCSGKKDL